MKVNSKMTMRVRLFLSHDFFIKHSPAAGNTFQGLFCLLRLGS